MGAETYQGQVFLLDISVFRLRSFSKYFTVSVGTILTDLDTPDDPRLEKEISSALRSVAFGLRIEMTA